MGKWWPWHTGPTYGGDAIAPPPALDSEHERLRKGARALAQEKGSDATPGATPEHQYGLDIAYLGGHRLAEIVSDAEKDHGRIARLEKRVAALEKAKKARKAPRKIWVG